MRNRLSKLMQELLATREGTAAVHRAATNEEGFVRTVVNGKRVVVATRDGLRNMQRNRPRPTVSR